MIPEQKPTQNVNENPGVENFSLVNVAPMGLAGFMADQGVDIDQVLAPWNFNGKLIYQPDIRIPLPLYLQLLTHARSICSDTLFHLHIARSIPPEAYRPAIIMENCVNLAHALSTLARYARWLNTGANLEFTLSDDGGHLRGEVSYHTKDDYALALPLLFESAFYQIVRGSSALTRQPFQPELIEFRHSPMAPLEAYAAFFSCPLAFERAQNAIHLKSQDLQIPMRGQNSVLRQVLEADLTQKMHVLGAQPAVTLLNRLEAYIIHHLAEGPVNLTNCASALNVSTRHLELELKNRGLTLDELVKTSQCRLAASLLRNQPLTLREVAFLSGFAEETAFYREFQDCFGEDPATYRLHAIEQKS